MTAEEKAEQLHNLIDNHYGSLDDTKEILIEFAKYHVTKALKAASESERFNYEGSRGKIYYDVYHLTNIK